MKNKRTVTLPILACTAAISLLCQSFSAMAQPWSRVDGIYQLADGTPVEGVVSRGIDVSYWQNEIDWNQVADDDVDFVMLGTRFRGAVDPYFDSNAKNAREAGLEVGAYLYSYATSVEMAEEEADFVLNLIKDYPISYPVAFDAEDNATLGALSPSEVSQVINAFCRKIEDAGYYPMVYANEYWLNNKIDLSMLDYDIWVARYNTMYTFAEPSMWQATNTGTVSGINGNVDIDFLFTDYGEIIPADTWRTIDGNVYYYVNHEMQKSAWIHDGSGWFYMDQEGAPSKGWLAMPEGRYYLDEESGRMALGWKQLDDSWYFFRNSGVMATGWRDVNGVWYYLNESGKMQTGWQNVGGVWYYLDASGAMRTGWQNVGGIWYYLNESGAMLTGWQDIGGARYYLDSATGQLAVNTALEWNGVRYQADENGICTPVPEETEEEEAVNGADTQAEEAALVPASPLTLQP